MSNNPFHELADFLTRFNETSGSVQTRWEQEQREGETAFDAYARVMQTFLHCKQLLEVQGRQEDISIVLEPIWVRLALHWEQWNCEPYNPLSSVELHLLRLLGNDADIKAALPKSLTADELIALRETFVKIQEVINSHESISKEFAAHIIYLCKRGIDLIDGETLDLVTLRSISFEVAGAAVPLYPLLSEEAQWTWGEMISGLWAKWGRPITRDTVVAIASGVATAAITQG